MRLRRVDLGALMREEEERIAATSPEDALARLGRAIGVVTDLEAARTNIPGMFDPTYHGADPRWRELHYAYRDLRSVLRRRGL
jgi:hypothetical protein